MIVAITDIMDSSKVIDAAMAKEKEAVIIAAFDAYHADILRAAKAYGGEFIKFMGDGSITLFQDDQADKALAYARAVIVSGHRFSDLVAGTTYLIPTGTRVGLAMGKIIRTKEDIVGDVINLAARLEASAEVNKVVLCSLTARAINVANALETDKVEVEAKGQRHKIRAWSTR